MNETTQQAAIYEQVAAKEQMTESKLPLPRRAAVYARAATRNTQGGENRLDWQLQLCRHYCDEQGYELDERHIYQDVASGANCRNRPALTALLLAAHQQEFAVLVLVSPDRLARHPLHLTRLLDDLAHTGIQLVFLRQESGAWHTLLQWLPPLPIEEDHRQCSCVSHHEKHPPANLRFDTTENQAELLQHFFQSVADDVGIPEIPVQQPITEHPSASGAAADGNTPTGSVRFPAHDNTSLSRQQEP